jgi:hypothetical protein
MLAARLCMGCALVFCTMGATCSLSCVSTSPHSVVFTPHYGQVKGHLNAGHEAQSQACETILFGFIPVSGDRSIEAAMPSIDPRGGVSLAYLTIDEFVKNYLIWQVACTKVNVYFVQTDSQGAMTVSPASASSLADVLVPRPGGFGNQIQFEENGADPNDFGKINRLLGASVWVLQRNGESYLGNLDSFSGLELKLVDPQGSVQDIPLSSVRLIAWE